MSLGYSQHTPPLHPVYLPLSLEQLEGRRLLSVTPTDGSTDSSYTTDVGPDDATEFWQLLSAEELFQSTLESDFSDSTGSNDPLPAVPFDESVDPYSDCPGVEGEFCIPGDANHDGSVDFSDFLELSANFGLQDASWADGDFDGDGIVSFADFVILSDAYGTVA